MTLGEMRKLLETQAADMIDQATASGCDPERRERLIRQAERKAKYAEALQRFAKRGRASA